MHWSVWWADLGWCPNRLMHSFAAASVHVWGHLEGVLTWWWWDLIWIAEGSTGWSRPQARPAQWRALHSLPCSWDARGQLQGQGRDARANHTERVSSPHRPCYKMCFRAGMNQGQLGQHYWAQTQKSARFPGGSSGKEPACQCRRHRRCEFDPWVRKIPWRIGVQPTPVLLESLTDRGAWHACTEEGIALSTILTKILRGGMIALCSRDREEISWFEYQLLFP